MGVGDKVWQNGPRVTYHNATLRSALTYMFRTQTARARPVPRPVPQDTWWTWSRLITWRKANGTEIGNSKLGGLMFKFGLLYSHEKNPVSTHGRTNS